MDCTQLIGRLSQLVNLLHPYLTPHPHQFQQLQQVQVQLAHQPQCLPRQQGQLQPQRWCHHLPACASGDLSTLSVSATGTSQKFTCNSCQSAITPVQLRVVAYFSRHLQRENAAKTKDSRRVKPWYNGEALTCDDVIQHMEEEEQQKREKKASKGRKRNKKTSTVQVQSEVDVDAGSDGKQWLFPSSSMISIS